MATFGGTIKLTGEGEYKNAISNCINSLKNMSTALKGQINDFNNSNNSMKKSAASQKELSDSIKKQEQAIGSAKSKYADLNVV